MQPFTLASYPDQPDPTPLPGQAPGKMPDQTPGYPGEHPGSTGHDLPEPPLPGQPGQEPDPDTFPDPMPDPRPIPVKDPDLPQPGEVVPPIHSVFGGHSLSR